MSLKRWKGRIGEGEGGRDEIKERSETVRMREIKITREDDKMMRYCIDTVQYMHVKTHLLHRSRHKPSGCLTYK